MHLWKKRPRTNQPAEVNVGEIWAEAEFYFQQGLFDEAKKHYNQIIALTPGNQRAIDRLAEIAREENEMREFAKLTDAVEGLEGYLPPEATEGVLAASASDDEAVRSLMQEIQQLKQQPAPPAPPPGMRKKSLHRLRRLRPTKSASLLNLQKRPRRKTSLIWAQSSSGKRLAAQQEGKLASEEFL